MLTNLTCQHLNLNSNINDTPGLISICKDFSKMQVAETMRKGHLNAHIPISDLKSVPPELNIGPYLQIWV